MNQNSFRQNRQIHFEIPLESFALTFTSELEKNKRTASIYFNSAFSLESHYSPHSCFHPFFPPLHFTREKAVGIHFTARLNFLRNPCWWFHWSEHSWVEFEMGWLCLWSLRQNKLARYNTRWSWNRHPASVTETIKWDVCSLLFRFLVNENLLGTMCGAIYIYNLLMLINISLCIHEQGCFFHSAPVVRWKWSPWRIKKTSALNLLVFYLCCFSLFHCSSALREREHPCHKWF